MWKLNSKDSRHSSQKQRGDTIIEVFLAMAIIGLSLGIAYSLSSQATRTGRQAQERTEALKLAESQLEILKGNLNSGLVTPAEYEDTDAYCVLAGGGGNEKLPVVFPPEPTSPCTKLDGGLYDVRVEYDDTGPDPIYTSVVIWDDPARTVVDASLSQSDQEDTRNRVELRYRP